MSSIHWPTSLNALWPEMRNSEVICTTVFRTARQSDIPTMKSSAGSYVSNHLASKQECKSLPRWCLKNLPSHTTIPPLPTTADQWPRHYHLRGIAAQKYQRRHPSRRRRRRLHPPPVWPRNIVST